MKSQKLKYEILFPIILFPGSLSHMTNFNLQLMCINRLAFPVIKDGIIPNQQFKGINRNGLA